MNTHGIRTIPEEMTKMLPVDIPDKDNVNIALCGTLYLLLLIECAFVGAI